MLASGHLGDSTLRLSPGAKATAGALGTGPDALGPALLTRVVPFSLPHRHLDPKRPMGAAHPSPDATLVAALTRTHRRAPEANDGQERQGGLDPLGLTSALA